MNPRPDPAHLQSHDLVRRVLIVEDYPDLAYMMTILLKHHRFQTQTVHSGELVYPAALSFRPHVILLDIGLPVLDGFEVAELIRKDALLDEVVLIALSAYGPEMFPERKERARFDHHIVKPVDFEFLLPLLAG